MSNIASDKTVSLKWTTQPMMEQNYKTGTWLLLQ